MMADPWWSRPVWTVLGPLAEYADGEGEYGVFDSYASAEAFIADQQDMWRDYLAQSDEDLPEGWEDLPWEELMEHLPWPANSVPYRIASWTSAQGYALYAGLDVAEFESYEDFIETLNSY